MSNLIPTTQRDRLKFAGQNLQSLGNTIDALLDHKRAAATLADLAELRTEGLSDYLRELGAALLADATATSTRHPPLWAILGLDHILVVEGDGPPNPDGSLSVRFTLTRRPRRSGYMDVVVGFAQAHHTGQPFTPRTTANATRNQRDRFVRWLQQHDLRAWARELATAVVHTDGTMSWASDRPLLAAVIAA